MKENRWNSMLFLAAGVIFGVLGLEGCSTPPAAVTLSPVGPKSQASVETAVAIGSLKVYSATEDYSDGSYIYHPHSHYVIYNNDGSVYKSVLNHVGMDDNNAELVNLPLGRYMVWANSETQGLVKVPVIIKDGKTTVVNLEQKPVSELDKPGIELAGPTT